MELFIGIIGPLLCYCAGWYVGYATCSLNNRIKIRDANKVTVNDLRPRD